LALGQAKAKNEPLNVTTLIVSPDADLDVAFNSGDQTATTELGDHRARRT